MISLFDYSIRRSRRARRVRIVVRPDRSVEVVLPQWAAKRHAHAFVREQRDWVVRSLQRFADTAGEIASDTPFPDRIDLPALKMAFAVLYRPTSSTRITVIESGQELHLSGAVGDAERVAGALQRWLKQKAKAELVPMLEAIASGHGFRFDRAMIRLQKSRWGSCSKSGTISLNAKLLFLTPELVRYVMLHELAHRVRMDHSLAFWAIVARCDDDYLLHRRQLRNIGAAIPHWAEKRSGER